MLSNGYAIRRPTHTYTPYSLYPITKRNSNILYLKLLFDKISFFLETHSALFPLCFVSLLFTLNKPWWASHPVAQSARLVAFPTTPHRAYDLFIPLFFSYPSCHRIPQFFLTCIGILRKGYFSPRPYRDKLIVYPDIYIYTHRLDFRPLDRVQCNTLSFSQYKVSTCYINAWLDIIHLCIILPKNVPKNDTA